MSPQPVDPEAPRRRDGYLERKGTWGEVTVGSLLATSWNRTTRWRIIDIANPPQIGHLETLWMRARDEASGAEHSIAPRSKNIPVTFLVSEAEEEPPPTTPASDAEQVALLVETLGAKVIATRDSVTGEIHCPDYDRSYELDTGDLLMHLRHAHGIDVSGIETAPHDEKISTAVTWHGRLHTVDAKNPPGAGFPHRHVPEVDISKPGF